MSGRRLKYFSVSVALAVTHIERSCAVVTSALRECTQSEGWQLLQEGLPAALVRWWQETRTHPCGGEQEGTWGGAGENGLERILPGLWRPEALGVTGPQSRRGGVLGAG